MRAAIRVALAATPAVALTAALTAALAVALSVAPAPLTTTAHAADANAGKARAVACAACHGENGVSVAADIPNLAGQKAKYLAAQLKAFREGTRKNPLMNAIAAQLSDADIENVAAFWNSLPGASGEATSQVPAHIARTRVSFPDGYERSYTHYTTINFADRKQVRRYFANPAAVRAAREGKPLPQGSVLFVEAYAAKLGADKQPVTGSDGFYEPEKLIFYTAMETQAGWGDDFPELVRNGDWNYAVFTADKKLRTGVNQAQCLACHKPLTADSYVFSLAALKAKASGR